MKSLCSTRNFAILLVGVSFFFIGFTSMRKAQQNPQATSAAQNALKLLTDPQAQHPSTFLQSVGHVVQIVFSQDGSRLFVRSDEGRITVYETNGWKKLQQWKTDRGRIFVSADGKRLFVAGNMSNPSGYKFSHWDTDSGKRLRTWSLPVTRNLPSFQTFSSVSPDLSQVVLSRFERNTQLRKPLTHSVKAFWIVNAHTGKFSHQVAVLSSKEATLTTRWEDQTLFIVGDKGMSQRFRISDWQPDSSVPAIADSRFNADGNILAGFQNSEVTASSQNSKGFSRPKAELILYNVQKKSIRKLNTDLNDIRAVFPGKNSLIVHGYKKNKLATKTVVKHVVQIRTPDGQTVREEIAADRMLIDAQWRVLAVDNFETYYDIFRAADGKLLCRLDKTASPLNGNWESMELYGWMPTEFSPDGKWYVAGSESGLIRIWALPQS